MAGLTERTPAGEIFSAQTRLEIAFVESVARVLPIKRDRFLRGQFFAANQLGADDKRISPDGRSPDVNRVRRHLPILRPTPHDAMGLVSFRVHARKLAALARARNGAGLSPLNPERPVEGAILDRFAHMFGRDRHLRRRDRRWCARLSESDRRRARSSSTRSSRRGLTPGSRCRACSVA